jgi:hypothetical protein
MVARILLIVNRYLSGHSNDGFEFGVRTIARILRKRLDTQSEGNVPSVPEFPEIPGNTASYKSENKRLKSTSEGRASAGS